MSEEFFDYEQLIITYQAGAASSGIIPESFAIDESGPSPPEISPIQHDEGK